MPAETHQRGRIADAKTVTHLLCTLLSEEDDVTEDTVLADLGMTTEDLDGLWDAVREELAERSVGPELDPSDLDPHMTVAEMARTMAVLLAGTREADRNDDEPEG